MKILWKTNIVLPPVAMELKLNAINQGSWLYSYLKNIPKDGIEIVIISPSSEVEKIHKLNIENIEYYVVPAGELTERTLKDIVSDVKPDIIHIHGTENVDSYNMMLASKDLNTVVSIQGLIGECSKNFLNGVPEKYKKFKLAKKIVSKAFNLIKLYPYYMVLEKKKMAEISKFETEILLKSKNVIGRTHWDKFHTNKINPNLKYFKVNEILRDEFYQGEEWDYNKCKKNSIFITQASYPIKGFHQFLKVLPQLKKKYPDIMIYIAGHKPIAFNNSFLNKFLFLFFDYQGLLNKYMKKYDLENNIKYLGSLNAKGMKDQLLKANLFLSCSTIENSPNSVGEAMILSVPIVASDVGGVSTMLEDKKEGLLYDFYDEEAMFNNICRIFDDEKLAANLGINAKEKAQITHDKIKNGSELLSVYKEINDENN